MQKNYQKKRQHYLPSSISELNFLVKTGVKSTLLTVLLLGISKIAICQVYNFPVKPGDSEWKDLKTHEAMVQACQIPSETLVKMNTSDLLESCLRYPLLFDVYAFNNLNEGFKQVSEKFNPFEALSLKKDLGTEILKKYDKIQINEVDSEIEKGNKALLHSVLEIYIVKNLEAQKFSDIDKKNLLKLIVKQKGEKQLHHEIYGELGDLTLGHLALKTLNSIEDEVWDSFVKNSKNHKFKSDNIFKLEDETLRLIYENIERIIKK